MKRFLQFLLLILFTLVLFGCDPGINFKPKGWTGDVPRKYAKQFDGFEITMGDIGGLIGEKGVVAFGCIFNRGNSPSKFEVINPMLTAASGEFQGTLNLLDANLPRTIEPGTSDCQPFSIQFKFDKELDKVLTKPVSIEMKIKNGSSVSEVSIAMEQEY